MTRGFRMLSALLVCVTALIAACSEAAPEPSQTPVPTPTPTLEPTPTPAGSLVFGMLLIGAKDDLGWSQAHFEAGQAIERDLGARMILAEGVNPIDSPDRSIPDLVDSMVEDGASLIFATSAEMRDGVIAAAEAHPDLPIVWVSGDSAWQDGEDYHADLPMLGNLMGRMEYGKMIAGCAAALQTGTGRLSYVGALDSNETRRLVSAAFLGARHCWTDVRGNPAEDLSFQVSWIGYWFNIPGETQDPLAMVGQFLEDDSDVIISGIDTREAIMRVGEIAEAGELVWAVPYNHLDACQEAPSVCLGVPYFNWRPAYLAIAESVQDGTFKGSFDWLTPDWADINNLATSIVGFMPGDGLTPENGEELNDFIDSLADGSLDLWAGPLTLADGSEYVPAGESATDPQIWYLPALLEGIEDVTPPGE